MKQLLVVLTFALFSVTAAHASLISCPAATGTISLGDPTVLTFTCGSLTFGNFSVASASGGGAGTVDINGAVYDSVSGTVSLNLDPNLGSSSDESLMFEVWGGVSQLDLAVGGTDATVTETACSSAIPTSGPVADICPTGTLLGSVSDASSNPLAEVFSGNFANTSPIYIFKDIETGNGGTSGTGTGQLSELDQSFEINPSVVVPEPVSVLLLGSGLLSLGFLRRGARKTSRSVQK